VRYEREHPKGIRIEDIPMLYAICNVASQDEC